MSDATRASCERAMSVSVNVGCCCSGIRVGIVAIRLGRVRLALGGFRLGRFCLCLRLCLLLGLTRCAGARSLGLRVRAEDALDDVFCTFGACCLLLLRFLRRCFRRFLGVGAREFFHHALGILLRLLGTDSRFARGLALLHDGFAADLCRRHARSRVEEAALLRILQRLIGAADLGKTRRGVRVALIVVRMDRLGHITPSSLDFVSSCVPLDAQNLIWIAHSNPPVSDPAATLWQPKAQ